ncbi:Klhl24 [Symbiodinium pilosum]|uniref:Klhl24 protein n=1 Tax=Symbiodinium pilosum TaxID=2952 RepID=A0A812W1A7_SYMPI|nr:Klhl24 [Symbiodinium pilosum]
MRIWEVADRLSLSKLLNAAKIMCIGNFEDIAEGSEFLTLSAERLLLLLGEDDLNISKEEVVFEAVRRWVAGSARSGSANAQTDLLPPLAFVFVGLVSYEGKVVIATLKAALAISVLWCMFPGKARYDSTLSLAYIHWSFFVSTSVLEQNCSYYERINQENHISWQTLFDLFSKVRFPIMSKNFVTEIVRKDPLMAVPEALQALLDGMQDGNYRVDTQRTRQRRRLKFDSSRVVGNSIEFLHNGSLVRSLRDARSFAVAAQPLSPDGGSFYACLTWYTGSIVYIGVATAPDNLNSWQAWVWNPSHPQFCRHRGGNMERSTNFGSMKVAQGDVIGVLRQGNTLIFSHNGKLVCRGKAGTQEYGCLRE